MGIGDLFLRSENPDYVGVAFGGYERGLDLSDKLQQRSKQREQEAKQLKIQDLVNDSFVTNPDGSIAINPRGLAALS